MRVVVTIGVFDGVHRGHASVLDKARRWAEEKKARLVTFTFDRSPAAVLQKRDEAPCLTLPGERTRLLRDSGSDEVRVLRFTPELAVKSPSMFLQHHVRRFQRIEALVVGYDFAMGRDREGTVPTLRRLGEEWGFEVDALDAVFHEGEAISSTRIRSALERGEVSEAESLLGRPYRLAGVVVAGDGRGTSLGYPTANLDVSSRKQKPAHGVYAVRVSGSGETRRPGVVNIGRRPTFGGNRETVEVHLPGYSGDLRGTHLGLEFFGRVRAEAKFKDSNELKLQIQKDLEVASEILATS